MHPDVEQILLTDEQIAQKVEELAKQLNEAYRGKEVICVSVLKGSAIFFADLVRKLDFCVHFEFMIASSYADSTVSSGILKIKKDIDQPIAGKHILIIEDILDTGNTLFKLKKELLSRRPASLAVCCLLDKPSRRTVEFRPDYVGFTISDQFVVGYGLDYNENYRHFPYIGVLKPECYKK